MPTLVALLLVVMVVFGLHVVASGNSLPVPSAAKATAAAEKRFAVSGFIYAAKLGEIIACHDCRTVLEKILCF